jgi:hypothetical protein
MHLAGLRPGCNRRDPIILRRVSPLCQPLLRLLRIRQLRLELIQPLLVARLRISEHLLQQRHLLLQRGFLRLGGPLRFSLRLRS